MVKQVTMLTTSGTRVEIATLSAVNTEISQKIRISSGKALKVTDSL